jgi:hypothetical protein
MLTKIIELFFKRKVSRSIEKLSQNDLDVRQSLLNLHRAGEDLHNAIQKHEDEYGKFFK